jgi:hypothetical protein
VTTYGDLRGALCASLIAEGLSQPKGPDMNDNRTKLSALKIILGANLGGVKVEVGSAGPTREDPLGTAQPTEGQYASLDEALADLPAIVQQHLTVPPLGERRFRG